MKKIPIELRFGRKPGTKLSNLKNTVSVHSKELSVETPKNSAREITDHLVVSTKKMTDFKYRIGMTFTQNKNKPTSTLSMEKNTNSSITFFEKTQKKGSLCSKFESKLQTAVSGTKHAVTTDKNEVIHKKTNF